MFFQPHATDMKHTDEECTKIHAKIAVLRDEMNTKLEPPRIQELLLKYK